MTKIISPILLLFLSACFSFLPKEDVDRGKVLQYIEGKLDAQSSVSRQFHAAAAAELEVPGYIVGIEKSRKADVGFIIKTGNKKLMDSSYIDAKKSLKGACEDNDYKLSNKFRNHDSMINFILKNDIESDREISYVSHLNRYAYSKINDPSSNVINEYIYNVYSCRANSENPICQHLAYRKNHPAHDCLYHEGWEQLTKLKPYIKKDINDAKKSGKKISHIIFYSMGWNTTQREAIQNFNFLQGNLINLAKKDSALKDFNPLLIGITWPSDVALESGEDGALLRILRPIKKIPSFYDKRTDADEIGWIWGNIILHDILLPIKQELNGDVKIVLIGHSFGARVVSNALFGYMLTSGKLWKSANDPLKKVDLLIGIQGAFRTSRFFDKDVNFDYGAYSQYKELANKLIYTWSRYDNAAKIIPSFIASEYAYKNITSKHPEIFDQITLDSCGNFTERSELSSKYLNIECQENKIKPSKNPDKILHVDASRIINQKTPDTYGGAHDDIYNNEVTQFIMNPIKDFTY